MSLVPTAHRWAVLLLVSLALLVTAGTAAQGTAGDHADEITRFLDDHLPRQLAEHDIPGAAVAVTSGQGTLVSRGYGVADPQTNSSVDPQRTVFAPASVAKPVTATAALRLVQDGELDLDADVNRYLDDVEVNDTHPGRPITMAHLLTHTAGFAAGDRGTAAEGPPRHGRLDLRAAGAEGAR